MSSKMVVQCGGENVSSVRWMPGAMIGPVKVRLERSTEMTFSFQDNMSSDPDTNKTARKWGDFTDSELQDHILRWNGARACDPSTNNNVLQAINDMFQYRFVE